MRNPPEGIKDLQIAIWSIGGLCPCQAHGSFYGHPFYYRSRHDSWSLEVSRPGEDPVMNGTLYTSEGDDPHLGFSAIAEAMLIIGKCFDEFTRKYVEQIYQGKPWPDLPPQRNNA